MTGNQFIVLMSLIAGIAGTGLGGLIGAIIGSKGSGIMGKVLSFAGGVMVGVVTFEMVPDAVAATSIDGNAKIGAVLTAVALTAGALAILGVNKLLDYLEKAREKGKLKATEGAADSQGVDVVASCAYTLSTAEKYDKKAMLKAGVIMLVAIALHNFPEGMAIGASGAAATGTGVLIAAIIAVHNIPEGMAIAAPLAGGGMGKGKAVFLTALAGAATVVGALIGLAVGSISPLSTGLCLALAGGAMLYVTFVEILPQATALEDGKIPSASLLTGILCALLFVFLF